MRRPMSTAKTTVHPAAPYPRDRCLTPKPRAVGGWPSGKKTKGCPSDLTDEEWEQFAPLMPKPERRGRPREVDFREVVTAVRYLVRSGCGWRMLPIHFGPWQTVYGRFRELARRFLFQTIHDVAPMLDLERAGREASPTAGVIDSQSVKAPQAETRGYNAGNKIVARKRHIAVDTDGRLLMVNLTTADISDSASAQAILDRDPQALALGQASCADGATAFRVVVCQTMSDVRRSSIKPMLYFETAFVFGTAHA